MEEQKDVAAILLSLQEKNRRLMEGNKTLKRQNRTYRQRFANQDKHRLFDRYEREKQAWIKNHPEAHPDEYTDAMRQIAKALGI